MRNAVAVTLALVAALFFALTAAGSLTQDSFGLTTVPASNACALVVTGVSPGSAMHLSAGDTIDVRRLSAHERLRLMVPRRTDAMMLPARRTSAGGEPAMIMAVPVRRAHDAAYAGLGVLLLVMLLGFYVLFKGQDAASLGLGMFFTMMPAFFLSHAYAGLPDGLIIAVLLLAVVLNLIGYFGLYVMVDALTGQAVAPTVRTASRAGAVGALAVACAILCSGLASQIFSGCPPPVNVQVVAACYAAVITLCFLLLWIGIARSLPADRGRLRWILWATVIGYSGPLMSFVLISTHRSLPFNGLINLTFLAIPLGYSYAVLRHRVIDVGFVLNRALSLTILTTAIVALFIVAESLIERLTANHTESMLLQLAFSVGLGIAFNAVHARLERWLERAIFRRRYLIDMAIDALEERIDRYASETDVIDDVLSTLCTELRLRTAEFFPGAQPHGAAAGQIVLPVALRRHRYGAIALIEDPSSESLAAEELAMLRKWHRGWRRRSRHSAPTSTNDSWKGPHHDRYSSRRARRCGACRCVAARRRRRNRRP